jgi:hypothetical protein
MVDWERNWRGSGIFFVVLFIATFGAGVAAVLLVLAGGTTWAGSGFWAPDGAYLRFVSPIVGLAWLAAVSGFLYMRSPSPVSTHDRPAVAAP